MKIQQVFQRGRVGAALAAAMIVALAWPTAKLAAEKKEVSMTDIQDIEGLKAAFNKGVGKPRLILLLSPT